MQPVDHNTPMEEYKVHTRISDPPEGIPGAPAVSLAPTASGRARWLEEIYSRYHRPELRGLDPIGTLEPYTDPADREVVALIAAALAYGNVKAILGGIGSVLEKLGPSPRRWLAGHTPAQIRLSMRGFRYRVTSAQQMAGLLAAMRQVMEAHGSLNACFVAHLRPGEHDIVPALGGFVDELCTAAAQDLYHLLPHPSRGSACKRLMLFLRWMVRCDDIDPGGWRGVSPRNWSSRSTPTCIASRAACDSPAVDRPTFAQPSRSPPPSAAMLRTIR
jgi:uncharacterized protein (TIGR02757 family)